MHFLIGGLVIAHGLVTTAIWVPNPKNVYPPPPMNTSHSWLLGDARSLALSLAIAAGLAIVVTGLAYLVSVEWWPIAGLIAGAMSLLLFGLFFTPWWVVGIAISFGLVIAALRADALS